MFEGKQFAYERPEGQTKLDAELNNPMLSFLTNTILARRN
jgi:hypothetical protein